MTGRTFSASPRIRRHRPRSYSGVRGAYARRASRRMTIGRIPRVASVSLHKLVPGPSTHEPRWALDAHGGRWVWKHVLSTGYEPFLSELLTWLLGREIGVPIPDGAVVGVGDDAAWLSRVVGDVVNWHPAAIARIANAPEIGRCIALDAIVVNDDRHSGNILLQSIDDLHVRAWAIDHDGALVGYPDDLAAAAGDGRVPATRKAARGLPVDLMAEGAMDAARAAAALPTDLLGEFVDEACGISGEKKTDVLLNALAARVAAAEELTSRYLVALRALP
jgi:hypothetical protein